MNPEKKENPFLRVVFKVVELAGVTSLFIIFSIPVFTFGASLSALYYTITKRIRDERSHVWQCFWHSFKSNFKQATLATLIFLAVALILMGDVAAIKTLSEGGVLSSGYTVFFYIVAAFLALYANWVFIYISKYENTLKATFKNAFIIAVSNLPTSFLMLLSIALTAAVVFILPITAVILPGASAWIMSYRAENVFEKYED